MAAGSRPPTRLTVFIGGTRQPKLAGWKAKGEDELRAVATRAVAEHLGVTDLPTVSEVNQGTDAIAQYTVGHKARVLEIGAAPHPNRPCPLRDPLCAWLCARWR